MSRFRPLIALLLALTSVLANSTAEACVRRLVVTGAATSSPSASPSPSASAPMVPASFTLYGSGFGHGIGLSQYGAQGMAKEGATSAEIIEHYFPGASVSPKPMPSNLIVGLLQDRIPDSRRFISIRGESVGGKGRGLTITLSGQKIEVPNNSAVTFGVINNQVAAYGPNGIYKDAKGQNIVSDTAKVTWGKQIVGSKTSTVANVSSSSNSAVAVENLGGQCAINSCQQRYKYGYLTVTPFKGGTLNITNTLRLTDEYLFGLGEMPSSWLPAALESQAIAGRSYAYMKYQAKQVAPYRTQCACQIYATTVDQNFVGFAKEYATAGQNWVNAVKATTNQVALYQGQVIETFFSSSTGGFTQPIREAWGTSGYPWLTKVDDHWSKATSNPNAKWRTSITQSALVGKLRAAGINVKDVATFTVSDHYQSGAVSELTVVDSAGRVLVISSIPNMLNPAAPNISPSGLRSIFELKSTYVRSIAASSRRVTGALDNSPDVLQILNVQTWPPVSGLPGDTLTIAGNIKPVQMGVTVVLSDLTAGKWVPVATTKTDIAGSWTLAYPTVRAGTHKLRVLAKNSVSTIRTFSTDITLSGSISILGNGKYKKLGSATLLTGQLTPAMKDITVYLYRKRDTGEWIRIAKTTTDELGKYKFIAKVGRQKGLIAFRVRASNPTLGVTFSEPRSFSVR